MLADGGIARDHTQEHTTQTAQAVERFASVPRTWRASPLPLRNAGTRRCTKLRAARAAGRARRRTHTAAMAGKLDEADKLMQKANKLWQPSIRDMRLKPDWESAAPLFETAAVAYTVRRLSARRRRWRRR